MPGHDRAIVIANPAARTISRDQVTELADRCAAAAGEVTVRWTRARGDATRWAAEAARTAAEVGVPTMVIAVGGDGTAREAAAGLAEVPDAGVPLMIVPAGTANSYYRALWGDRPWADAVDAAVRGRAWSHRVDLAVLAETGALVLAGCCAGFPPQAIHEAEAVTGLSGRARYQKALVDLVPRYEPFPARVVVDGVTVYTGPTLFANIGGSRYRGGQYDVLPRSVLDDGLLDVCVVGGEHPAAEMLRLATTGDHVTRPGVVYARGRRISIERTDGRPAWFEHDGEVLVDFGARFTLEVVPAAVAVYAGEQVLGEVARERAG